MKATLRHQQSLIMTGADCLAELVENSVHALENVSCLSAHRREAIKHLERENTS
jgi:hypothetical protein